MLVVVHLGHVEYFEADLDRVDPGIVIFRVVVGSNHGRVDMTVVIGGNSNLGSDPGDGKGEQE